MEHYVTLLDSLFLPQVVTLHQSMERHAGQYSLWILCVDEEAHQVLSSLALSNVRLLKLSDLETPELLSVKHKRSRGEYCWTLTPYAPRFVFEHDSSVQRVTYIDADIWFRKPPDAIFSELDESRKSVLITEHAFSPAFDLSEPNGIYCVQFITFDRYGGEKVRKWWEERCIEWCYARVEDGKFGDQKYLEAWVSMFFSDVHVLRDKSLALGPWNASRFPFSEGIFYHFHQLRLTASGRVLVGKFPLPAPLIKYVYRPYLREMKASIAMIEQCGGKVLPQVNGPKLLGSIRLSLANLISLFGVIFSRSTLKM
ncbi:hypothetical protein [Haliea sp.]|uniref:hypothetical protein n=1 Tax=Haliea sp. TaxID=1932666 RepID=UPI003526D66A